MEIHEVFIHLESLLWCVLVNFGLHVLCVRLKGWSGPRTKLLSMC